MYIRKNAIKLLSEKYGYKNYGDKHCESIFTKWFQNTYLPRKFGLDKRIPHLSSLICSGQLKRDEALKEIAEPLITFNGTEVPHRLGFGFNEIEKIPIKNYKDYPNSEYWWELFGKIYRKCKL